MIDVPDVGSHLLFCMKLYQSPEGRKRGMYLVIESHYALIAIFGHIQEEQRKQEMNSNTSEVIANITEVPILSRTKGTKAFNAHYREKVFYIWYNQGRPSGSYLINHISPELDERKRIPTVSLLKKWIASEFNIRAKELDDAVKRELDNRLIAEKVEMLKRHAELGLQMQDMAINFLNENVDTLSAPAAVRMLVEGVRIERESRGIPAAIDKMMNMSDEQLMKEVQGLITEGSTLEELDASSG